MTVGDAFDPVAAARAVIAAAATGALATLGRDGSPFASLVTMAHDADGAPLILLSDLAEHTRNLTADARASLLVVAPGGESGNPLAGTRVSLVGTIARHDDEDARRIFLARRPEAARSATFADFRLYRMAIRRAHLVAGFGRIVDIEGERLLGGRTPAA